MDKKRDWLGIALVAVPTLINALVLFWLLEFGAGTSRAPIPVQAFAAVVSVFTGFVACLAEWLFIFGVILVPFEKLRNYFEYRRYLKRRPKYSDEFLHKVNTDERFALLYCLYEENAQNPSEATYRRIQEEESSILLQDRIITQK